MKAAVVWWLVIIIAVIMLLCGCKSVQYVPIESVRTEYVVQERVKYDSIYMRDSIAVKSKADTVYLEKYKYLYKYMFVNKNDTVIKNDTINIPYPVERSLSRWESMKMELGGIAMGISIGLIIYLVIKRFFS